MYRKKTLLPKCIRAALSLCLALLFAAPGQAADLANDFSDVPQNAWYAWYCDAVDYVRNHGMMSGTSEQTFSPDLTMTRAMLATVLYRLADSPTVNGSDSFSDTPDNAWYSRAVAWAEQNGYTSGYGGGMFGPNDPVTREQMVTMLWRWASCPDVTSPAVFEDEDAISVWAAGAVDWAAETGIVYGRPGNNFAPAAYATRAESAVILSRYHQLVTQAPPEEAPYPDPPEELPQPTPPAETPDPLPPEGQIPANPYDAGLFTIENGFLTYQGSEYSYVGIDVSSHQNQIDWDRVAAAGVDFAMIRAGYRGYTAGQTHQDPYFTYNISNALRAGLDVGIYFFSQAITEEEAIEEARVTLEWIQDYEITYPVVFDWERISGSSSRTNSVDGNTITRCARAFCEAIERAGYVPMTYGSPSKIGVDLHLSQLLDYPFWLAHYTTGWQVTSFPHLYHMWQYSSHGSVDGISGRVDLNICMTNWELHSGHGNQSTSTYLTAS